MQTKAASTLSALQVFELDRRSSPVRNTKNKEKIGIIGRQTLTPPILER